MAKKEELKILMIGKDGAAHSLLWKLSQSACVRELYCYPKRDGFGDIVNLKFVPVASENQIYSFAKAHDIDLVVIRSEEDLVKGMADRFRALNIAVVGPSRKDTWLEADKFKAKNFMKDCGIPTPMFFRANTLQEAYDAIDAIGSNVVVKANWLAGGKGVGVFSRIEEAKEYAKRLFSGELGTTGKKLVIEERLYGEEASVIAIVNGKHYYLLPNTQDYKPVFDGNEGPNTGGTGAYGPTDKIVPYHIIEKIKKEVIEPAITGLMRNKADYRGVIYFGIMKDRQGKVWLLEFNMRFGDPESEIQMLLLDEDLAYVLYCIATGHKLLRKELKVRNGFAVGVVAMAEGYPGRPKIGDEITGLDSIIQDEDHVVFHANTVFDTGVWKTAGGRVLVFVAFAQTLEKAIEEAYKMIAKVRFRGMHFRMDIGQSGL